MAGHSSGEIAAAYAAGMLTFESAIAIAYHRGTATSNLKARFPELKGAMLAIGAGQSEVQPLLRKLRCGKKATIACINSPSSITASGDEQAITELQTLVEEKRLFNRRLRVDMAYHSHHMTYVAQDYLSSIKDISSLTSASEVMFYSSVTGRQIDILALQPSYWVNNLTCPVRFSQAVQSMCAPIDERTPAEGRINTLIELGPHSALEGPIGQILKASGPKTSTTVYVPSLIRNKDAVETTLQLAATLCTRGCPLNFSAVNFPKSIDEKPGLLTDLPSYPWQHSTRYWHESRISSNHRFKQCPRNDLVGSIADGSNDLEPTWRNIIRLDDLPWIRHHQLQSDNIYPMAGYVAMAAEAASQRALTREIEFDRITFREISFGQPLIILESLDVESMITLRPYNEGTRISSDTWDEFRVSSWASGRGWLEHCRGLVAVQTNKGTNPIDGQRQLKDAVTTINHRAFTMDEACTTQVDSQLFYETLAEAGVVYKSAFQGLVGCRAGQQYAVADMVIPDTTGLMPHQYEPDMIMHPATLEICTQIQWLILGAGRTALHQSYTPSFVKEMSISRNISRKAGDRLRLYGSGPPTLPLSKPVEFSIFATDSNNAGETAISLEGLVMTPLTDKSIIRGRNVKKDICFKMHWEMSLNSIKSAQFQEVLCVGSLNANEKDKLRLLERASFYYIMNALQEVTCEQSESLPDHYRKFYRWMQSQSQLANEEHLRLQTPERTAYDASRMTKFLGVARTSNVAGELISIVGESLPQILQGEIDPLPFLMKDNLLNRYTEYLDSLNPIYAQTALYIDKLAQLNPALNILEFGTGVRETATLTILKSLGGFSGKLPRFKAYTYTDMSSDSLEMARARFDAWGSLVSYGKLNLEADPILQGYEAEMYDLIVAPGPLHATTNNHRLLHNVRKLLKPGGTLLVIQETAQKLRDFIYAILPGWSQGKKIHLCARVFGLHILTFLQC